MKKPIARALCCNDLLCSMWVHDFVSCKCGKSFLDGGGEYIRIGGDVKLLTTADAKSVTPEEMKRLKKACEKRLYEHSVREWDASKKLYKEFGVLTDTYLKGRPKAKNRTKIS